MVFIYRPRIKSPIRGPCEKISTKRRPISIGASVEQKPWAPTIRKGLISAEPISGKPSYKTMPTLLGPIVVDSNKKSAPAYSMGRTITRHSTIENGPAKYCITGVTNKGVQSAPAYSLKSRRTDVKRFEAPAANKYYLNNAFKATTKTIATYSFGKKPIMNNSLPTPAPNVYNLPPVFGTAKEGQIKAAPAFSMQGRKNPKQARELILPGPGEYENNYRYFQKSSPHFSMHSKHKVISDEHMKPGPAAYCPERYIKHKSVPAPSISILHTPYLGTRKAYLTPHCKSTSKAEWIL